MLGGGHGTARRGWGVYYRLSSVYYRVEHFSPEIYGASNSRFVWVVSIRHLVISYVCLSLLTFFKMLSTPTRFT